MILTNLTNLSDHSFCFQPVSIWEWFDNRAEAIKTQSLIGSSTGEG